MCDTHTQYIRFCTHTHTHTLDHKSCEAVESELETDLVWHPNSGRYMTIFDEDRCVHTKPVHV